MTPRATVILISRIPLIKSPRTAELVPPKAITTMTIRETAAGNEQRKTRSGLKSLNNQDVKFRGKSGHKTMEGLWMSGTLQKDDSDKDMMKTEATPKRKGKAKIFIAPSPSS